MLNWLCALAILLQGAVLQTHIHTPQTAEQIQLVADTGATGLKADQYGGERKQPAKGGDPANCFLCQQLKLAGSTILAVSPEPAPIVHRAVEQPAAVDIATIVPAASHDWQSRGPPLSL